MELIATRLQQLADAHTVLAADQQQMSVLMRRLGETQLEMAQRQSQLEETVGHVVTAVGQLSSDLRSLAQSTDQRFQEMGRRMEQGFQELREAQQHTEQNLNALIKIVDDLIRRDGGRR